MIRQSEVDGVPALLAPTTGPMHAGLMFRVGQADETLARRGITHLLEHLVLHPLGVADYHYNGTTGVSVTHFHMQGSAADITTFLTGVCTSLGRLATDRLEIEKSILRTERSGRGNSPIEAMPLWRYGARNYGLVSFPEWGLTEVTPDELREWSARYFTRENAVLWLAGDDVPPGLTLDLPAGHRYPVPVASSALPRTPAYFHGRSPVTALQTVVRRQAAATVFSSVLERKLFQALRQEGGLSYTAATDYDPRGDGFAVITALADALPEKHEAVLGGFIDVLASIRIGRIDDADVTAVVGKSTEALGTAEADAARLPSAAFNLLTGRPVESSDSLVRELKAVTAAQVHQVAVEALDSALLMTPGGCTADWAGFAAAPTMSEEAVTGTAYPGRADDTERLVVGPDGVSIVSDGNLATVRYDRCQIMLAWPDGARLLIGDDGISVRVEPTLYRNAEQVRLDDLVPARTRVAMPARDADQIPQPEKVHRKAPRTRRPRRTARQWVALVVIALIALGMAGLTVALTVATLLGETDPSPLALIGGWSMIGYFGWVIFKNWRKPQ